MTPGVIKSYVVVNMSWEWGYCAAVDYDPQRKDPHGQDNFLIFDQNPLPLVQGQAVKKRLQIRSENSQQLWSLPLWISNIKTLENVNFFTNKAPPLIAAFSQ